MNTSLSTSDPQAGGSRPVGPWQVISHSGIDSFQSLQARWRELELAAGKELRFLHAHAFLGAYLATLFPGDGEIAVLEARRDGRTVAFLALVISRRQTLLGPSRVATIPHDGHWDLSDALALPGEASAGVCDALLAHALSREGLACDAFEQKTVLADALLLRSGLSAPGLATRVTESRHSNEIDVEPGADPLARLTKNFRANLRKARNKLAELPGTKFEFIRDRDRMAAAVDAFIAVEDASWKGRGGAGTSIALQPRGPEFFHEAARRLAADRACEVAILSTAGRPIGAALSIQTSDTLYVMKIAYEDAHARCAPGNLLIAGMLARAAEGTDGVRVVSLVTGLDWHALWAPRRIPVFSLLVHGRSARGRAFALGHRTREAWQGAVAALKRRVKARLRR